MRKILITITIVVALASCTNANLIPRIDEATLNTTGVKAEIVYTSYNYTITRVWVNGLPYLVNSQGGIILEASEAEYGELVDRVKDGSK